MPETTTDIIRFTPTMELKWFPAPKTHKYGQWQLRQRFMGSDGSTMWKVVGQATAEGVAAVAHNP